MKRFGDKKFNNSNNYNNKKQDSNKFSGNKRKRDFSNNQHEHPQKFQKNSFNELKQINKQIAFLGKHKRLGEALDEFAKVEASRLHPTIVTFTSIINACVRCGEMDKAFKFFEQMKEQQIEPNEITLTAIIKGYCDDDDMEKAMEIFEAMKKNPKAKPNLRTFNTLLRSCLRSGNLTIADTIVEQFKACNVKPDVYSFQYLIKMFAQSLDLEKMNKYTKMMEEASFQNSIAYASCAHAYALKAKIKSAQKCIAKARSALEKEEEAQTQQQNNYNKKRNAKQKDGEEQQDGEEAQHSSSISLFLRLRREEVAKECEAVEKYIEKIEEDASITEYPSFELKNDYQFIDSSDLEKKPLSWDTLFPKKQQIKMEVCSGGGEWVTSKAQEFPHVNWIAVEMRHTRCIDIWNKCKYHNIKNVIVLKGEALHLLKTFFTSQSVTEIFVNYPDPPVWEQSKRKLISRAFLTQVHQVMDDEGSITLVTDFERYANSMVVEFKQLTTAFESAFGKDWMSKNVPKGYGSSYFDRFWQNGRKTDRFFLKYLKKT